MKKLYLIGGTMGVGKTAVCQKMKRKLHNSVFLDGDWCWDSDPFQVTEETKEMVMQNICFLLNQFLHCSAYDHIIFCWVMHEQNIIDTILERIDKTDCNRTVVSLTCDPDTLCRRLEGDISRGVRGKDIIKRSIERLPLYNELNTVKIHTEDRSLDDIAGSIIRIRREEVT